MQRMQIMFVHYRFPVHFGHIGPKNALNGSIRVSAPPQRKANVCFVKARQPKEASPESWLLKSTDIQKYSRSFLYQFDTNDQTTTIKMKLLLSFVQNVL